MGASRRLGFGGWLLVSLRASAYLTGLLLIVAFPGSGFVQQGSGAVCTDILHIQREFSSFSGGKAIRGSDPDPGHGSAHLLVRRAVQGSSGLTVRHTGPWGGCA